MRGALGRWREREWSAWRRRSVRVAATLVVTGLCVAYIVLKIDIGQTLDILGSARYGYLVGAVAIMTVTVWPMAWRWQRLLEARSIDDRLSWLTRAYFVGYTAGQVLPTSVGGDAARIFETSRRHPGHSGPIAGSVLLERALGGAATLVLAAVGFALALGEYDVGAYLWIELAFVIATVVFGLAVFSRAARRPLAWTVPLLRRLRVDRPIRAVYEGIHAYRRHTRLLVGVFVLSLVIGAVRVLAIWLTGEAVGEAFFVSFLGQLGVSADEAFAAGFLFFLVTVFIALPGAVILAWESFRRPASATVRHG